MKMSASVVPVEDPVSLSTSDPGAHQEHYVIGAISFLLQGVALGENLLPVLVVLWWKRPRERTVLDKLLTALCVTFIFSALVPTPIGLVSYVMGRWYGGKNACECYQVTSTCCNLSALGLVTIMCLDKHRSMCRTCAVACVENVGLLLLLLFTLSLLIATLPVIGLGPVTDNVTCDSWIVATPSYWKHQVFFIMYLSFGYLNMVLCTCVCVYLLVLLHKPELSPLWAEEEVGVGDGVSQLLRYDRADDNTSWLIVSLVFLLQLIWTPMLVMLTCQKLGMKVSDAAITYALLATSLPALLTPILCGLLMESYREGYKKAFQKLFSICCSSSGENNRKDVKLSERKRLTKVRLRDYSQIQGTEPGQVHSYETDSITELVDAPDSCDEDSDILDEFPDVTDGRV